MSYIQALFNIRVSTWGIQYTPPPFLTGGLPCRGGCFFWYIAELVKLSVDFWRKRFESC